jgi:TM2 domain-containing membrane protein YozV
MNRRDSGFAFLFWAACLVGVCGLHRFYLRRYVSGFIWLFTLGLLGVGQFVDLFLINGMVRDENEDEAWIADRERDRLLDRRR